MRDTKRDRKYIIKRINAKSSKEINRKRIYKKKYPISLLSDINILWKIFGYACARRLKPIIPFLMKRIDMKNELLERIGYTTLNSFIRIIRIKTGKGISATRQGGLLRKMIPIRVRLKELGVGHLELDTVHHCSTSLAGAYVVTLNTSWSEFVCLKGKEGLYVIPEIVKIIKRLPFPVISIDSDNGRELINNDLVIVESKKVI